MTVTLHALVVPGILDPEALGTEETGQRRWRMCLKGGLFPMALRDLRYQEDYRSGYNNLVEEFFRPSLREASTYWRAVGYFSSTALEAFGSPLGDFVLNGGKIRLVTSIQLTEVDLNAIASGRSKETICTERLVQIVSEEFADGVGNGVARLSRLLELGQLEIRIAVPKHGSGIYHEKIGVFEDTAGDFVAFSGSSNESRNAFENNRECMDVYPAWESPVRAARKRRHFEQVWAGTDIGVDVYSFPEAAKQQLLQSYRAQARTPQPRFNKWRHQDEAIEAFLAAERGVLNMATGTGKTRTALKIMQRLFEMDRIDNVIITTEGKDLLKQWYSELLQAQQNLPRQARIYRDFDSYKELQVYSLETKDRILLVSRDKGPTRDPLAAALRKLALQRAQRTLLVSRDPVHVSSSCY
ncbi:DEAD/DEAH box helicase family protein [Streptomyces sp. NPDC057909]|uniref:DEAD/DEAH box helicase family protein n=1 Tax=Streptomyces sp. NPDC057909 TaxID=3346277 RepID=UPI0036E74528